MKKFGILIALLLSPLIALIGWIVAFYVRAQQRTDEARRTLGPDAPVLTVDGLPFRDLNKNGKLDIYEDHRRPVDERVEDLLRQMTLDEKAGMMMHPMINATKSGELEETPSAIMPASTTEMVAGRHIKHFNIVLARDIEATAAWYNNLQRLAERTRLGIPVTISTDPRHSTMNNPGAGIKMDDFSHWPEALGLAAARDAALVEQFGDIARQEYIALGIRTALHPMADIATEPRWARLGGTFGEDANLCAELTAAYIRGFQGAEFGSESVSCMVKHFPGGGPQKDGLDPHFPYGREQVYPGNNFEYHLIPFEAAFAAGVTQIMPYYGIPVGQTGEDVGMAFNKEIITGMLRERFGFEGVICADWMIAETNKMFGLIKMMDSTSWGVEHLTVPERYQKAIDAGVDQFGGQFSPLHIIDLVRAGNLSEARIDESVRRLLRLKFQLGLFDDPYIDASAARQRIGTPDFKAAGIAAQRKSVVLLKNGSLPAGTRGNGSASRSTLPLTSERNRPKLYVENVALEIAARYGDVVATPQEADFAILRLKTPYDPPRGKSFLERFFHQGDLDFKGEEKERILSILQTVPTIVDIYLERAAVIPEIAERSAGLFGTFGVIDEVLLDAVFGLFNPSGKLPIELPSSMDAVRAQRSDVPCDSENPVFAFGHGLSYSG